MVSSCTNVQEKSHLRTLLDHNFRRHYKTNKAPLSLSFNPSWLVQNPDFVEVITDWMDSILATYKDVYFTTDFQLILWMMNPISSSNMAVKSPILILFVYFLSSSELARIQGEVPS